jgi:hypothetical protein
MIRTYLRVLALTALSVSPALAQFGKPLQVNGTSLRGKLIQAGDVDLDGDEDVIIGDSLGQVAWRPNVGGGNFATPRVIDFFDSVIEFTVADLDGDLDLDVLVAGTNGSGRLVNWYEYLGAGNFAPGVTLGSNFVCSNAEAADMDGDGDLDVLTHDFNGSSVFYYENVGGGVFSSVRTEISPEPVASVYAADLDGDGDQDVVAGFLLDTPYGFRVLENLGGGAWASSFAPNVTFWGRYTEFAFGDLDNDGDLDIMAASGADRFDWYDQIAPMVFRNRQQFFTGGGGRSLTVDDIDADGDLDVLMFGANVDWQENLGGGAFATHEIEGSFPYGDASLADLDGSGTLDVLYSTQFGADATRWKPNLGSGMFGPAQSLSVLELGDPRAVAAADFDGDGDLDVAAVSNLDRQASAWENQGTNLFSSAITLDTGYDLPLYEVGVLAVDVDSDGDPDVVVAAGGVYWYENLGSSTFTFGPRQTLLDNSHATTVIQSGDLNGDGLTDIIANSIVTKDVTVFFGAPGGPPVGPPVVAGNFQYTAMVFAAADFDEDGDDDLIVDQEFGSFFFYLESLPGNTFGAPVSHSTVYEPHTGVPVDIDQDGLLDYFSSAELGTGWSRGLGDGTFEPVRDIDGINLQARAYATAVMDVNNDSRPDVVLAETEFFGPSRLYWVVNVGAGQFALGGEYLHGLGFLPEMTALDFDGDLDSDLLLAAPTNDSVNVLKNEGGLGAGYCSSAALHSGGGRASIRSAGSALIANNDLTLEAYDLPLNRAGYFLVSRDQGFVQQPAGSQGNICLGGTVGRYVHQLGNSGSTGTLPLIVDAQSISQPLGNVAAVSGETWSFQCWFRDIFAGAATSNFTSGFAVRFQ